MWAAKMPVSGCGGGLHSGGARTGRGPLDAEIRSGCGRSVGAAASGPALPRPGCSRLAPSRRFRYTRGSNAHRPWSPRAVTEHEIRKMLGLEPLPNEGGFFVETYRATRRIPDEALPSHPGDRSLATAIYYLITPQSFSAIHRVRSDEIFHFYMGDAVEMLQLAPDGSGRMVLLGTDLAAGERPQVVVPAGVWQGARLRSRGCVGVARHDGVAGVRVRGLRARRARGADRALAGVRRADRGADAQVDDGGRTQRVTGRVVLAERERRRGATDLRRRALESSTRQTHS